MRRSTRIAVGVLAVVAFGSCIAWAGPLRTQEISAEATWAVHLDVERLVSSQIGKHFMKVLEKEGDLGKIEAFGTLVEFDPFQDLHGVTAYGKSFGNETAVALIKGRFDNQKILALIRTRTTPEETLFEGMTIYNAQVDSDRFYLCFPRPGLVVFSNEQNLFEEALTVLSGRHANLSDGGKLKELGSLPAGTFIAGAARGFGALAQSHPEAMVLQKAESVVASAGELEGVDFIKIALTARNAETAMQIQGVVQGFIALGQLFVEEHPELAGIVNSVELRRDERTIVLRATKPAGELFEMFEKTMK